MSAAFIEVMAMIDIRTGCVKAPPNQSCRCILLIRMVVAECNPFTWHNYLEALRDAIGL